ncbi:MAG: hypothetical protein EHM27_14985 [Deltaproteobacteria bacterium]|nr:MAG: hypothetical protein EHM27_14985 [Deltaproteobacteria bacterium]
MAERRGGTPLLVESDARCGQTRDPGCDPAEARPPDSGRKASHGAPQHHRGKYPQGFRRPAFEAGPPGALTHHERYDGKGYPRGLKGEKIPLEGRITILADIFDALSSRRVYKEALPENEVLGILEEGRGVFFDPEILPLFLDRLEEAREVQSRYGDRPEDFDKFRNLDQVTIEDDG